MSVGGIAPRYAYFDFLKLAERLSTVGGRRKGVQFIAMGAFDALSDTSPEVRARMEQHYRAMTPAERIERAIALTAASQGMSLAAIQSTYPGESPREHRLRLLSRLIARERMIANFGWDPVLHGY